METVTSKPTFPKRGRGDFIVTCAF